MFPGGIDTREFWQRAEDRNRNTAKLFDTLGLPEFYALEGLTHLLQTIEQVKRVFNSRLSIQGVVLTMYDKRNNLCELVAADVRGHFGEKVYGTVIPRNVKVSEAPSHGKPVLLYDVRCAGSQAYIHLAREVLQREQMESMEGTQSIQEATS